MSSHDFSEAIIIKADVFFLSFDLSLLQTLVFKSRARQWEGEGRKRFFIIAWTVVRARQRSVAISPRTYARTYTVT